GPFGTGAETFTAAPAEAGAAAGGAELTGPAGALDLGLGCCTCCGGCFEHPGIAIANTKSVVGRTSASPWRIRRSSIRISTKAEFAWEYMPSCGCSQYVRGAVKSAARKACYCSFANSPTPATATQSRVVFFTKYIASSARCSSSALVRESVGYDATPTLAVRLTFRPGSRSHFVSRMSLWMR